MKRFTLCMAALLFFTCGLFAQSSSPAQKQQKAKKTAKKVKSKAKLSPYMLAAQRAREASKKHKGKSVLVVTNQSLKNWSKSDRVNVAKPDKDAKPYKFEKPTDTNGRGEEYWRMVMMGAQARVKNIERQIKELESKVNRLKTDFYNRDDPAYRDGVVKPAWDAALEQLKAAKQELQAAKEYLDNLPDEARKAGALPGWLR